ncbi:hypothetical protein SAMN05444392_107171 [Seinonella peptonophila]|uniref:Uncharacterized protein n=1 Tax=Seinonella peptonophila TaxID=112248 RepID=A0A1M4YVC0_9BACL|nr:hypothetical protein [Seinonella peptonophila]SHF09749.1 hypothetical protein SAMN05444392_107171 [Seinonella peptonophila]
MIVTTYMIVWEGLVSINFSKYVWMILFEKPFRQLSLCFYQKLKGDFMDHSRIVEEENQGPDKVRNFDVDGCLVKVRRECSFNVSYSSGEGLIFIAENKHQVDELLEVLEGIQEQIKKLVIEQTILKKVEEMLDERLKPPDHLDESL